MNKKVKYLSGLGLVIAILVVLVAWRVISNARADRRRVNDRPLPVDVVRAKIQPMPVLLQAVGQVQSEHTVQIRPQVSGVLKRVFFTEGQHVETGQRLFQIDPAPFAAALSSAQAAYDYAKANVDRETPLAKKDYVTPQEYQNTVTAEQQAQAALQQAKINLAYTDIRAPLAGRTGALAVKAGNVVSPTDATPLVTINQMKPILVQFSVAQQFLPAVRRYASAGGIRAFITNEDGSGNLAAGRLVFIDNTVNTDTGTVMLKAEVPNKNEQLWPGQYVGVNMQLTVQPDAVVIPDTAVQTGQNGNFVYLVENGKAVVVAVTVNRQVGALAVISTGLKGGETVITRVSRNLRPGIAVSPNPTPQTSNGSVADSAP